MNKKGFIDFELDPFALAGGVAGVFLIFALRNFMLNPFLEGFTGFTKIFWGTLTYIVVFIGCYLIMLRFRNE